jgi:DNA polymerase-1
MNLGSAITYGPVQTVFGGVRFPIDYPDPSNVDILDHGALPLIERMHAAGIYLDQTTLGSLHQRVLSELDTVREQIDARITPDELRRVLVSKSGEPLKLKKGQAARFNPASGDQVARLLYDCRELDKLSVKNIHWTGSRSRLSVDDDALVLVSRLDPIVPLVLDYVGLNKLRSTYTGALAEFCHPVTSCIHTQFDVTTVVSGRLASRRPNLMNIPIRARKTTNELLAIAGKLIRNCFMVRPDFARPQRYRGRKLTLVSLDLSQIEMVTAAFMANDQTMKRVFLDGKDMHTFTALAAFGSVLSEDYRQSIETLGKDSPFWEDFKNNWRVVAKTVGFGILYGQEAEGLQQSILSNGGPLKSIEECQRSILDWYALYHGIRDWSSYQRSRAMRYRMVWDLVGRHRWIPSAISALPWVQSSGFRESGNTPVQSLAQAFLKLAMAMVELVVQYYQSKHVWCAPLLQIHDELIFEVEESAAAEFVAAAKACMEGVVELDIPIKSSSSLAECWGDLK